MMEKSPDMRALLARLDERTVAIQNDVTSFRQDLRSFNEANATRFKELEDKTESRLEDLETHVENVYVTKEQFGPVQKLVYGFVGVVILSVLGAILSTVIVK